MHVKLLVTYHPAFFEHGYDPLRARVAPAFEYLEERGYLDRPGVEVLEPAPAPMDLLERVHTRHHIEDVAACGYLDVSRLSTGGVVEASRKVAAGEADNAFCFVGAAGHHASREGFWGFCFINDVAVAAEDLLETRRAKRLAVVDIDPHYGDGTRDILGGDHRVLHVNFHSRMGNGGTGAGGTNVDVPLPHDAGDGLFLEHAAGALDRAREFEPALLFVVFGYDSYVNDYGAFRFTIDAYRGFARAVSERFPTGACYVLSGGSGVETGKAAIGAVVDSLLD